MDKEHIREEMTQIQLELGAALANLRAEIWDKLDASDKEEINKEFANVEELLERIKSGYIWLAFFGKTNAGKSSTINSLLRADLAPVEITHDTTKPEEKNQFEDVNIFTYERWKMVDLPGIMGKQQFEQYAIEEAKKAHGHIFVIDGEPHQDELEMFNIIQNDLPDTPKIVFVNKWDQMAHMPTRDRDAVKLRIEDKMSKYVGSPEKIVYGSARFFNQAKDAWDRQELPQLEERMYDEAGTFGEVVAAIDPANKANDLSEKIRQKVMEVRIRVARKIIKSFAMGAVAGGIVPFSSLIVTPGLLGSMIYVVFRTLGVKDLNKGREKIAGDFLKTCAQHFGLELTALTVAEFVSDVLEVALPFIGTFLTMAVLSDFRYKRTALLGELAIEYVRNDCSWGGEDAKAVISRCKKRIEEHYGIFNRA